MSRTFSQIQELIVGEEVRISEHGYDELAADGLSARELVAGMADGTVVEDYPEFGKGPCVLVLQRASDGRPIHAVWGIPAGHGRPAVLITAYIPDSEKWTDDFLERKK